jgi:hypothetical protein
LFVAVKIAMAPKDKRDPVWIHCHLNEEGKKACNYCGKTVKGGGIHRIKQHLAHERGQVEPCSSVSVELKEKMQGLLESFQVEKAKNKKIKKDREKSN